MFQLQHTDITGRAKIKKFEILHSNSIPPAGSNVVGESLPYDSTLRLFPHPESSTADFTDRTHHLSISLYPTLKFKKEAGTISFN